MTSNSSENSMNSYNNNTVVRLLYPFPAEFPCPFCFNGRTVCKKGACVYLRHTDLFKHLKLHHPGAIKRWSCAECGFTDDSAYALKKVKSHHATRHPSAGGPCATVTRNPLAGSVARATPGDTGAETRPRVEAVGLSTGSEGSPPPLGAFPVTLGGTTTCAPAIRITAASLNVSSAARTAASTAARTTSATGATMTTTTTTTTSQPRRRAGPPTAAPGKIHPTKTIPAAGSSAVTRSPVTLAAFLQQSRRSSAGEDAPAERRTSGGPASMGRRSGGNTTSPPAAASASTARKTRASTEPPQPGPPRRAPSRRVTPSTTFAEVTRGSPPAVVGATTTTVPRRTRAASLPPAPTRRTRTATKRTGGATATSSTPPATPPLQSPPPTPCSAPATLTTTTVTTTVRGSPVMTAVVGRSSGLGNLGISKVATAALAGITGLWTTLRTKYCYGYGSFEHLITNCKGEESVGDRINKIRGYLAQKKYLPDEHCSPKGPDGRNGEPVNRNKYTRKYMSREALGIPLGRDAVNVTKRTGYKIPEVMDKEKKSVLRDNSVEVGRPRRQGGRIVREVGIHVDEVKQMKVREKD
ncbi:unnamed protein product [Xylocopa violacea]|uniref:C2H2-type domain-containing protein n=1 Tax=Xylocopa violacea TaxID=135666 RepID=A0ABP1N796_XYLVO